MTVELPAEIKNVGGLDFDARGRVVIIHDGGFGRAYLGKDGWGIEPVAEFVDCDIWRMRDPLPGVVAMYWVEAGAGKEPGRVTLLDTNAIEKPATILWKKGVLVVGDEEPRPVLPKVPPEFSYFGSYVPQQVLRIQGRTVEALEFRVHSPYRLGKYIDGRFDSCRRLAPPSEVCPEWNADRFLCLNRGGPQPSPMVFSDMKVYLIYDVMRETWKRIDAEFEGLEDVGAAWWHGIAAGQRFAALRLDRKKDEFYVIDMEKRRAWAVSGGNGGLAGLNDRGRAVYLSRTGALTIMDFAGAMPAMAPLARVLPMERSRCAINWDGRKMALTDCTLHIWIINLPEKASDSQGEAIPGITVRTLRFKGPAY